MTTIYVHDTFTRNTTGGNLGTADTGQAWSNQFGSIDANGTQAVVDAGSTGASLSYLDSSQSNCTVQVTLSTLYDQSGIAFRYTGGGTYWYVIATPTDPAGNNYQMSPQGVTLHMNNAGDTTVATYTSIIPKSGDVLAVTMNGSVYTVFLNGVQIISYTDSTNFNTTATKHGLFQNQHGNAGNLVPGTTFDDFYVADGLVTGGGSSPTPINASASLQGQGSLSASANIVNPNPLVASASISALGTITSNPTVSSPAMLNASATMNGTSSMTSSPTVSATVVTASASMQGIGTLSATGQVIASPVIATANIVGQATLSSQAIQDIIASSSFQGTSSLMSNAVLPASISVVREWNVVFDPKKLWTTQFSPSKKVWNATFESNKTWIVGLWGE